jgi:phospholipase C
MQEPGARPARALPYELHVESTATPGSLQLRFNNTGKQGAVFHVRSATGDAPRSYTVGPNADLSDSWKVASGYDLAVYGPNGFLRTCKGSSDDGLESALDYDPAGNSVQLRLRNNGTSSREILVHDTYTGKTATLALAGGQDWQQQYPLTATSGWYDFIIETKDDSAFRQQLAGHLETGKDSMSDPGIAASKG